MIAAFVRGAGGPASTRVVVHYPLLPLDPRNFTEGELGGGMRHSRRTGRRAGVPVGVDDGGLTDS